MKRKLEAGTHLVVDRYAYSGVAFSTAKVRLFLFYLTFSSCRQHLQFGRHIYKAKSISHFDSSIGP